MLNDLHEQPADQILTLMEGFRNDPRSDKVDLGVGVYRDAAGRTPIMRAVKKAERRLWDEEATKSYTGLGGDPAFATALSEQVLGGIVPSAQLAAVATPGGTGAFRQGVELIRMAAPQARIWISRPTWSNHLTILDAVGRDYVEYRYFDAETGLVDTDGMIEDLQGGAPGDVVLLHGCCHNPTGADLTVQDWQRVADLIRSRGMTAFVDLAYQGFGDGLDADAEGTRILTRTLPEMLIGVSCSKNFGIYRERAGLLLAASPDVETARTVQGNLEYLNRQNYSFPPDHGARLVTMILTDPDLRADWQAELEDMRTGMMALRRQLSDELRQRTNSNRFDFVAEHRGMFSRLGLTPEEVETLRRDHAIYMVGDSRINIAGLSAETVPLVARAVAEVCARG